jgi:hypothetical protein
MVCLKFSERESHILGEPHIDGNIDEANYIYIYIYIYIFMHCEENAGQN